MSTNYEEAATIAAGHEAAPNARIAATPAVIKISDSDSAASNDNSASKMNDTAKDVDPSSTTVKLEPEDALPPMDGIAFGFTREALDNANLDDERADTNTQSKA